MRPPGRPWLTGLAGPPPELRASGQGPVGGRMAAPHAQPRGQGPVQDRAEVSRSGPAACFPPGQC